MSSDELANLTLEYLKRFDSRLERMENDVSDIKFRLRQVEETISHHTSRFDRIDDRLLQIEKRLDLVDA